jgi:thiol-disulfide isomerase/thioredoxin
MRRGGAGLIAAVLVLAGCKNTDHKSPDKEAVGIAAARNKNKDKEPKEGKGNTWLDPVGKLPGAETGVPKAGSWASDPANPNFNAKAESQDAVGGRVVDTFNRPAKNVFVRVEEVNAPPGKTPMGIYTDQNGYFFTRGLKPGKSYNLTAEATQDNKPLIGTVQTVVPNPVLTIILRDDLGPVPMGAKGADAGTFPPPPTPNDRASDRLPPLGLDPLSGRTLPRQPGTDGAFTPGGGVTRPVPPTIGGPPGEAPAGGGLPQPDDLSLPPPKVERPENVAGIPRPPFTPPAVSVPGPATLPPPYPSPLPPVGGLPDPKQSRGQPAGNFTLLDTLHRTWNFATHKSGSVVLVEFITTTCGPCKRAIPVLTDLQARYAAAGLQVIAVVCDDLPETQRAAAAAKYAREQNLNYALFIEPGEAGSVRDRFDVKAYPTAVLLDSSGTVLWQGHPADPRNPIELAVKKALGR